MDKNNIPIRPPSIVRPPTGPPPNKPIQTNTNGSDQKPIAQISDVINPSQPIPKGLRPPPGAPPPNIISQSSPKPPQNLPPSNIPLPVNPPPQIVNPNVIARAPLNGPSSNNLSVQSNQQSIKPPKGEPPKLGPTNQLNNISASEKEIETAITIAPGFSGAPISANLLGPTPRAPPRLPSAQPPISASSGPSLSLPPGDSTPALPGPRLDGPPKPLPGPPLVPPPTSKPAGPPTNPSPISKTPGPPSIPPPATKAPGPPIDPPPISKNPGPPTAQPPTSKLPRPPSIPPPTSKDPEPPMEPPPTLKAPGLADGLPPTSTLPGPPSGKPPISKIVEPPSNFLQTSTLSGHPSGPAPISKTPEPPMGPPPTLKTPGVPLSPPLTSTLPGPPSGQPPTSILPGRASEKPPISKTPDSQKDPAMATQNQMEESVQIRSMTPSITLDSGIPSRMELSKENLLHLSPKKDEIQNELFPLPNDNLRPGRLKIKLKEVKNVIKKGLPNKKISIDPFIKVTIGKNPFNITNKKTSQIINKSKTLKKCSGHILFNDEIISLDILQPNDLIYNNDIILKLELWDENMIADEFYGQVELSILDIFNCKNKSEILHLIYDDESIAGEILFDIKMEIAYTGILSLTIIEGRDLKSMELIGKQDPYCKFELKNYTKRTKTIEHGGKNPFFNNEEILFWITNDLWIDNMILSCYDEDVGSDDLIGNANFSILHFMQDDYHPEKEITISLYNKQKICGNIILKAEFYPAGILSIFVKQGKNLRKVDVIGREDPYIKFILEGSCTKTIKNTKVDKNGSTEPIWNEMILFELVDQYSLMMECWDEDTIGNDDMIGFTIISLLPIFRYGFTNNWFPIYHKGKFGGKELAGQIELEINFTSRKGLKYPQHQPGMDSFDEKERLTKEEKEKNIKNKSTIPSNSKENVPSSVSTADRHEDNQSEFTEKDILGAFQFIDLNKNTFIGSAEIRHILICMGELVTDEEIDEMMKMCDKDGDGQISFDEFRQLVIHPNPSTINSINDNLKDNYKIENKIEPEKLTSEEIQRQVQLKQQKMEFLQKFINENNLHADQLSQIFIKYKKIIKKKKYINENLEDYIDFDEFCTLFNIEPTGEYKKLFSLYEKVEIHKIDIKELLLGACNFVNLEKSQRVKFCFDLFDDDHNGFITENELINILKANHMTTEEQVKKKAKTILKQADINGDNRISLEEFASISKKFPNILFPVFQQQIPS